MRYLFIALLGVMTFYTMPAWAYNCSTSTGSTTINVPPLTVQRDTPVGTQIGNEVVSGWMTPFICNNSAPALTYQELGVKAYGDFNSMINGRRVYNTNIAGIGYAIGTKIQGPGQCFGYVAYVDGLASMDGNIANRPLCANNGIFGSPVPFQHRVTFYKTANVTGSGTVTGRQVGSIILRNNLNSWHLPESAININSFNITTLACFVGNTNIVVPMGNIKTTAFSGVGSSPAASNTRKFDIPLFCDLGTRVYVSLTGAAVSGTTGVLALDSAGSSGVASGVGIQVLSNNVPVTFGKLSLAGTSTSGPIGNIIPFQARYYQTAQTITAGKANSSATFTLTYQ